MGTPSEFVDVRLLPPAEPSRFWWWWVNSTPRALLRKLIGLDVEAERGEKVGQALADTLNRQTEVIKKLHDDLNALCTLTLDLSHRLEFYEKHDESIKYHKARYDRQTVGSTNGSGLVLLDRQ